jgi:uncharacterized protein (TIGR02996 family)
MSDETAFLRVIADAPADNTARLVYADWLDEHDNLAQAAFLRAECAWAALPPAELRCDWGRELPPEAERYPPALRELTTLAEPLRSDWFAAVSRIGWETQALADRLVARAPGMGMGEPMLLEQRVTNWNAALVRVQETFTQFVGERVVQDRFVVPVDYASFALHVGGLMCPEDDGWADFDVYFDEFFSPNAVAERTDSHCRVHAEFVRTGGDFAACGLWLFIGFRDKHHFHLCCDRESPLFGTLVDMHDSHPWICPPHGPVPWEVEFRCFIDFLRWQTAKAERDE